MKITLDTDRLTTILGLVMAFLILQQELWPNLLPEDRRLYTQAVASCLFGLMTNKNKKITLHLNGEEKEHKETIQDEK